MKKNIYVASFIILGILLQQIIHTVVEVYVISLLVSDFDKYGLGLSWDSWFTIHHVATFVLLLIGILFGYFSAKYWWPRLYDENGMVRVKKPWRI